MASRESRRHRYTAFISVATVSYNYQDTSPVAVPAWAAENSDGEENEPARETDPEAPPAEGGPPAPRCAVCGHTTGLSACVMCSEAMLCRQHCTEECPGCRQTNLRPLGNGVQAPTP